MSGSRRSTAPVVRREYAPAPAACEKAIELLLKSHVKNEGGSALTAPDDAKKESKHVGARSSIQ